MSLYKKFLLMTFGTTLVLCRAPDDERLDSFETCRADKKKLWNKIDYMNCASRWSLTHCFRITFLSDATHIPHNSYMHRRTKLQQCSSHFVINLPDHCVRADRKLHSSSPYLFVFCIACLWIFVLKL